MGDEYEGHREELMNWKSFKAIIGAMRIVLGSEGVFSLGHGLWVGNQVNR